MPRFTIFAGVNGAGKTSIYKSIYYMKKYTTNRTDNAYMTG